MFYVLVDSSRVMFVLGMLSLIVIMVCACLNSTLCCIHGLMMINALTWLFGYLFTLLQNDNIDQLHQLHSRHGVSPLVKYWIAYFVYK